MQIIIIYSQQSCKSKLFRNVHGSKLICLGKNHDAVKTAIHQLGITKIILMFHANIFYNEKCIRFLQQSEVDTDFPTCTSGNSSRDFGKKVQQWPGTKITRKKLEINKVYPTKLHVINTYHNTIKMRQIDTHLDQFGQFTIM